SASQTSSRTGMGRLRAASSTSRGRDVSASISVTGASSGSDQRNTSGSPSGSYEPSPYSTSSSPTVPTRSPPASATGGRFSWGHATTSPWVVAMSQPPRVSQTSSSNSYEPRASATGASNCGCGPSGASSETGTG